MKRLTVLIALAAVLAIGAGPWVWNTFISPRPQLELDPMKYTEDSSWSALPVQEPEAVWSGGWGVDVFLISEDSALSGTTQVALQKKEQRGRRQAQSLKSSFEKIGEVYAPLYRNAAVHDDVTRAFETYLRRDNRGRALIIAHDRPVPDAILARLEQDSSLRGRFGGFLSISDTKDGIPSLSTSASEAGNSDPTPYCNERLNDVTSCQIVVPAHREKGLWVLTSEGVPGGEIVASFPEWLEANVGKMAEPLGDFEEVEIVDIRRPGETDENSAADEN
ncbi:MULTISPECIES: DUF3089 domain-containing protein [Hyphomonas]|uniref:DUF3089 domain-containing protein n=1 Tax=Hyphomonas TaxID=85 RepID=UPI003510E863